QGSLKRGIDLPQPIEKAFVDALIRRTFRNWKRNSPAGVHCLLHLVVWHESLRTIWRFHRHGELSACFESVLHLLLRHFSQIAVWVKHQDGRRALCLCWIGHLVSLPPELGK